MKDSWVVVHNAFSTSEEFPRLRSGQAWLPLALQPATIRGVTDQRGQSLLEVLVAMAIAIIIVGGLVAAVIVAVRNAQFAKNQALATKYANEGMEKIRSFRDQSDWDAFKSGCSSFNLGVVPPPFTRPPATCQEEATDKMKVTVTVSWTDPVGSHKSELTSYFTKRETWQ